MLRLPGLRGKSKEALQDVRSVLSKIPQPPSNNPTTDLLRLINHFEKAIIACVTGHSQDEALIQHCRTTYEKLKADVKSTTPKFSTSSTDIVESSFERPRSAQDIARFIER